MSVITICSNSLKCIRLQNVKILPFSGRTDGNTDRYIIDTSR